jgi:pyruvate,orthophosphate dikinase
VPYIYAFDHVHPVAPKELKALLGGKGANLAEMTSVLGLPVPPGFTITTDACRAYLDSGWPDGLDAELSAAIADLEARMGRHLGDPDDPLLVSVRSGAQFSMPGMMDTVLNLGLNDASVQGLWRQTSDERFAYDSYRRFIAMYARIVLGLDPQPFEALLVAAKARVGTENDGDLPASELRGLVERYQELVGELGGGIFPQDPRAQLRGAIEAVFRSWNGERAKAYREREGIPEDLGTAVNVQAMVFGNRDDRSGTGVGFTRDPATGEQGVYGDFLVNAQGEDVVAGIRITQPLSALAQTFPDVFAELMEVFARLERHYRDMCDVEFTIEQGRLWLLQTRVGKRTGVAALRMAVQMTRDPAIALTKEEAVSRITPDHLDQVLHPQFAPGARIVELTRGLGASPGAAVGKVYLDAESAVQAAARGERVILVRKETSPEDVRGMLAAEGVLTTRGGLVSHAAVVARGWGKPAVVGADAIVIEEGGFRVGEARVAVGEWISIDGTSGQVVLGEVPLTEAEPPAEFETVLAWADEIAFGRVAVRANADTAEDAARARRFGAKGIGLCRTEHMFLAPERLPIVRRMILAETPEEEERALGELFDAQREDFRGILEAMSGLPVTVRLLDPPLHEFLPDLTVLERAEAAGAITEDERRMLAAARAWHEQNPMIGIRGVRLGVLKPGLYAMQVRALLAAAEDVARAGGEPIVEVMIPLTVCAEELERARAWVDEALDSVEHPIELRFGTMIETPRAALVADELASLAEFFSFGTNDLTQMTFGFSRDDVEGKLMPRYLADGILPANPFKTVDAAGVVKLVRMATDEGRRVRPGLKVGVCGEHGGDPASIAQFVAAGLDYVSASPFRVPIARLSVAHALLRVKDASETA